VVLRALAVGDYAFEPLPGRPAGAGPQRLPSCAQTRRSRTAWESSTSIRPLGSPADLHGRHLRRVYSCC
jgi:hypothetical protein